MRRSFIPLPPREDVRVMFGVKILFIDGMARLKDIQMAYCKETGSSEGSTDIDKWKTRKKTRELIEFLENDAEFYTPENGGAKAQDLPKGDRGGLFVCKELAHHYASWLDPRYAAYVLRTFDEVVMENYHEASRAAKVVCESVQEERWDARIARLRKMEVNVGEYIKAIVYAVANSTDIREFDHMSHMIIDNPEFQPTFNRFLDMTEMGVGMGMSPETAASHMSDMLYGDPDAITFVKALEEYKHNS